MIEISLLKALSNRSNLDKYVRLINPKTLSTQSVLLLKDYQAYFSSREVEDIDFGEFKAFFFLEQHSAFDDKSVDEYKDIIGRIESSQNEEDIRAIITAFERQELYNTLHNDLDNNINPKELLEKVTSHIERHEQITKDEQALQEDMDLHSSLDFTDRSEGLKWRLKSLQDHFQGGLIQGDFGLIAGFTDSGKTSFLCSEVSYMAEQLEGDQWIAWLNTEGSWQQIIPRIYQAALNCTMSDLKKWPDKAVAKYEQLMKGNKNRIKVLNFQRKSTRDVEKLLKVNPPSLIVFDLLDHINGFNNLLGKEGNATERYGALYQWARTIATEACPVLAISQLNGDGNDQEYPSITNLRGSRVDKQSAATFQLIIGSREGDNNTRYLSMPKNKVSSNKSWRAVVSFDPIRSRFSD